MEKVISTLVLLTWMTPAFGQTSSANPPLEDILTEELSMEEPPPAPPKAQPTTPTKAQKTAPSPTAAPSAAPAAPSVTPSVAPSTAPEDVFAEDEEAVEEPAATTQSEGPPREPPYTDNEEQVAEPKAQASESIPAEVVAQEDSDGGTKLIRHPDSKKGLLRITKKGEYLYRVKPSPQRQAASLGVSFMSTPKITNPTNNANYADVYGTNPMIGLAIAYEYQLIKSAIGKFGIKVGSGVGFAQGRGRFRSDRDGKVPRERFTFVVFPNNASVIYRMQFWDKQPLVPFAEGGGGYFTFLEDRNDKKPTKYGGALTTHFAGGVAFSLNWIDKFNMSRLDQEYGINNSYIVFEYRRIVGLNSQFDFSSNVTTGSLLFEF